MTASPTAQVPDAGLLDGVARGDAQAVTRLLDEVAPVVYGFLLGRVGSSAGVAEDLLQEVLLEGLRGREGFRGDSSLSTWLCAIARRRVARYYEAERRDEIARSGLALVRTDEVDEDEVTRRAEVNAALGRLPVLHRQVLVLKYLDDCSVAEIADAIGRTPVQVQSLLQRARAGLKRELGGDADG